MKDAIGAVSYVEFVLHPAPMFDTFVEVADKVLEAIQPAGGAQPSEPQQQVRRLLCVHAHEFEDWAVHPGIPHVFFRLPMV